MLWIQNLYLSNKIVIKIQESIETTVLIIIIIIVIIIIIIIIIIISVMWKQNATQVIPIVISSKGVIPKSLLQSLKRLNLYPMHIYKWKNL
jgi:hypothetical protein